MVVGGYSLHLYCAKNDMCKGARWEGDIVFGDFGGSNLAMAKRDAVKQGWRFSKGDVVCPYCSGKRKSVK